MIFPDSLNDPGGNATVQIGEPNRRDKLFLRAIRAGLTARQAAARYNVSVQTVYNGVCRARLAEKPAGAPPRSPTLVLAFGASCKALAVLRCQDVHPCRACGCQGCVRCGWTGLAKIPKGSAICCGVCHQSGRDSHPALRRHPSDPKPDRKPLERPEPRRTRKERRSVLAWLEPKPN